VVSTTRCGGAYNSSPSQLLFRSPSGQTAWGIFAPVAGDDYSATVTVPRYAETGTWNVNYVSLVDCAGNGRSLSTADLSALGFAVSFTVTGQQDVTAPVLHALAVSPSSVDVGAAAATVTVTATITDDLSGVVSTTRCGGAYN